MDFIASLLFGSSKVNSLKLHVLLAYYDVMQLPGLLYVPFYSHTKLQRKILLGVYLVTILVLLCASVSPCESWMT
jgi:hypothetical protein